MTLLALDLGTNTGFAIQVEGSITSGSINFKPRKFDGGGMRFLKFEAWLNELHKATPVHIVVFEGVRRHIGTDAAHIYGGLMATLMAWCEKNKVAYEGVPVATIKKFVTGKGNADKETVMAAVKEKWGFNPKDSDEADALALLHLRLYDVLG